MSLIKWQWVCIIILVFVGCTKKDSAKTDETSSDAAQKIQGSSGPVPPFKFAFSFEQMKNDPRKYQAMVDADLATKPEDKKYEELEARYNLAQGFEILGDFDSAAKNYLKCESLAKETKNEGNLVSVCMLGLARVARFSSSSGELTRLYDLRNNEVLSSNLKIQFYAELINSLSFSRDFAKAKKFIAEVEPSYSKLKLLDQFMLKYSQLLMLIDAKEFSKAEPIIGEVRGLATKLGTESIAWVDHAHGTLLVSKKDFTNAKAHYQKAVAVIGKQESQFNAFWVNYLGLKLGVYMNNPSLIESSHKACANILRGSEAEKKFMPLIDAWVKLSNGKDLKSDEEKLTKNLGKNTNCAEELNVAKAWKKSK